MQTRPLLSARLGFAPRVGVPCWRQARTPHRKPPQQLCRDYWYPLYVYARRKGHQKHDAQDLTQEFFARLIRHNCFGHLRQDRGLFRSYLLKAFQFFMADQWDHARAEKRGGGQTPISLDDEQSEHRYLMEPASDMPPEKVFDQRWALTLLERAITQLRAYFAGIGKEGQFEVAALGPNLVSRSQR